MNTQTVKVKNEKPIIMSGAMVKKILSGEKTQTRRVVKPQPVEVVEWTYGVKTPYKIIKPPKDIPQAVVKKPIECPYQIGDLLWVRETWRRDDWDFSRINYKADVEENLLPLMKKEGMNWKPSIHMPREASRITLEITNIKVERLQDISVDDAEAEGVKKICYCERFSVLWDKINGKREGCSWDDNPFVWAIEFKKI